MVFNNLYLLFILRRAFKKQLQTFFPLIHMINEIEYINWIVILL